MRSMISKTAKKSLESIHYKAADNLLLTRDHLLKSPLLKSKQNSVKDGGRRLKVKVDVKSSKPNYVFTLSAASSACRYKKAAH